MTQGNWLHKFRRTFSALLAVVMLVALLPLGAINAMAAEADTTLYLKPNTNWLSDGARFAVYYWNDGGSAWTDMSDADSDGYYEASIPSGYSNIIFCRMSPGSTDNNWNNKWNQTSDLTVPTDGSNCYTVADGTWDNGGGTWSSYTPDVTLYLKPNANWLVDNARFAAYFFGNGETWVSMTDEDGDGYYEVIAPEGYPSVIFCRMNPGTTDNNWNNKWNQTADLTVPTDGSNCYTVPDGAWDGSDNTNWSVYAPSAAEPEVTYIIAGVPGLCGSEWAAGDTANQMTLNSETGLYEKTYPNVPAGTYEFKVTDGTWNNSWGNGSSNYSFNVTETSDVTISFNADTKEITVSQTPVDNEGDPSPVDYYLIGYINGADYGCENDYANLGEYKFVDGTLTATFTQDSYVFIKTGDNANWYMAESYCTDTTVTLKNTTTGTSEKLYVPGNVELTFTLVVNDDDTLTLSYATPAAEEPEIPEGYTAVTIHFYKTEGWGSTIYAYTWNGHDNGSWPGSAVGTNASHPGWYDLFVPQETPAAFNFIFNDGGNQTGDLATGEVTGNTELWVVGNTVYTAAPGEWTGDYNYTANIYFQKPESWGYTINAYLWDANGALPGYESYNSWPGKAIDADTINAGWYKVSVTMDENTGFYFIFNDGSNQTADLSTGPLNVTTDIWVVNGQVQTTAPDGWVDPNRSVHVPGTFPGPNWDAGSNQMNYDADLGLYVYTFEDVPAANYEFKIAINGSWNENYGAGGVKDGANIAVTVPETMDVIVYYNDQTHNAVTNVSYIFADISLSGTGIPDGTKLSDAGLTGIYSVTVDMAAGTYSDVKLSYDGKDYAFAEFELTANKVVTFYMDPVTGIFYHNASNTPIDDSSIYYNSQDEAYKAPYGAVADGQEVSFSIRTGEDITSAVLVIKGVTSVPMTKNGDKWTATTSIANIGEYDYYFVLSNGSSVAVYGDDDGYYREGTVSDLTNVMPYDRWSMRPATRPPTG